MFTFKWGREWERCPLFAFYWWNVFCFYFILPFFWCGRNLVSRSSRAFSPLFSPWAVLPVGWPLLLLLQTWFGRLDHFSVSNTTSVSLTHTHFQCFWLANLFLPSIMKLRCSILILLAATTAATLAAVAGKHLAQFSLSRLRIFWRSCFFESEKWFKHNPKWQSWWREKTPQRNQRKMMT